jgi:hypothetical protein
LGGSTFGLISLFLAGTKRNKEFQGVSMPDNSAKMCIAVDPMNRQASDFFKALKLRSPFVPVPETPGNFTDLSCDGCRMMIIAPRATSNIGNLLKLWAAADEKPRLLFISSSVDDTQQAIRSWLQENQIESSQIEGVIQVRSYDKHDVLAVINQPIESNDRPAILTGSLKTGGRPSEVAVQPSITSNKKPGLQKV